MAKVLIASLGDAESVSGQYSYKNTFYYPYDKPDNAPIKTPFVAIAMKQIYDIDNIIFIGTAGSAWFSLYEYLYSKDNSYLNACFTYDDDYCQELLSEYENLKNSNAQIKTNIMQEKLKRLKDSMGSTCRDIVILEYGKTIREQFTNLAILNNLAKSFEDGDEVYFDISHSFRSLPFYELLAINLAKSILEKDIRIEMVSYGMYEIRENKNDKTPIVDMTQLIELLDWTRAVEEYNTKGSFELFMELLNKSIIGDKFYELMSEDIKQSFECLVKTMSLVNNSGDFKAMMELTARSINDPNRSLDHPLLMIINKLSCEIFEYFQDYKDDALALLLASVQWKIEKGQTVLGALLLVDAIENVCLTILGMKLDVYGDRKYVHDKLLNSYSHDTEIYNFASNFKTVNNLRIKVAHAKPADIQIISTQLKKYSKWFLTTYTTYFAPNKPKRQLLFDELIRW